jgi:hypothetical protein
LPVGAEYALGAAVLFMFAEGFYTVGEKSAGDGLSFQRVQSAPFESEFYFFPFLYGKDNVPGYAFHGGSSLGRAAMDILQKKTLRCRRP